MRNRLLRAVLLTLAPLALLAGCASYYRVTDPTSGRDYYTQKFERTGDGSVKFKDGKTNSEVTLQNSEVSEIKEADYKKGITAQ